MLHDVGKCHDVEESGVEANDRDKLAVAEWAER